MTVNLFLLLAVLVILNCGALGATTGRNISSFYLFSNTNSHTFCHPLVENLLENGNFNSFEGPETETFVTVQGGELTGWTTGGAVVRIRSGNRVWGGASAVEGTYLTCLNVGWWGGASIRQEISGLVAHQTYRLWWQERNRSHEASGQAHSLEVHTQDGQTISALHEVPGDDWSIMWGDVNVTAGTTTVIFHAPGGSTDGSIFLDALYMKGNSSWVTMNNVQ
jgi:hypothetical protein